VTQLPAVPVHDRAFGFGPFRLYRAQKLLLEDGRPVRLGSRALDILLALVERAGEVVGKEELVAIAWPRTVVEESSLRVHVAALRKVLGDGQAGARYIVNLPGRGYCFVASVTRELGRADDIPEARIDERVARLPPRLTRMIGRAEAVALLAAQLKFGRFVTVVGPGGIGKTTLALAVAEAQSAGYEHGVCYVDLAPVVNGQLISAVLMAGLGLSPRVDGLENLDAFIQERRLLIVFDNCEHLLDAMAPLVEHLLRSAPQLHVLATSREPMRAEGEWLHRLGSLSTPPASAVLTAQEALRFSAVELFVERATASLDDFTLADRDAALVGELCHRLDGNPLAIELAAARVDLFGLRGLSAELDSHVLQLKGSRRDAPSRHHSLSAMLSWSYQLLTDSERLILNRLGLFQGWFPLRAAADFVRSIDGAHALREDEVFDGIANLAAKSLLTSDASGELVQFRLLELTRAYALSQLDALGQRAFLANCHAAHTLALCEQAAQDWTAVSKRQWFDSHSWLIDELRAALAWSFSGQGNPLTGCQLTVSLWSITNVVNPFDQPDAVERALAAIVRMPGADPALEMRLNIALGTKSLMVDGRPEEANRANARALQLAEQVHSPELEAEALMSILIVSAAAADYMQAAESIGRLAAAARRSGSPALVVVADRIGAQVWHLAGDHARCRMLAERVLNHPLPRGPIGTVGGGVDHRVSMRIMLSRALWIEGFADQAASVAAEVLELASHDDAPTLTQTLSLCVCPLALWRGDTAEAQKRIAEYRLLTASQVSGGIWLPATALIPWWLSDSIEGVRNILQRDHLMTARAHLVTSEAAARAAQGMAGWCGAELLRARGEQLLPADAAGAEALFQQSLVIAASQQALAWELRSATSLARLWMQQGRRAQASELLVPVYRRFTEGFATADLVAAAALLEVLESA